MTSEFGELLRHARAYKGATLRDAERETRINRQYLVALEHEEFNELPPLTYARGIVRRYAEYLGLDPVSVLAKFEDIHGQRSGGFRVVPAVKPLDVPSHWAPNFAIIAFMVVMAAVIFAWMYSAYFAPADSLTTPTAGALSSIDSDGGTASTGGFLLTTPTPQPQQGGGELFGTPAPTPTPIPTTPAATPTVTAAPSTHKFVVTTTERVWVEVTVDGENRLSDTLASGTAKQFSGKTLKVVSGNAAFVRVSVDGVDQGTLGSTWNAEKTYP